MATIEKSLGIFMGSGGNRQKRPTKAQISAGRAMKKENRKDLAAKKTVTAHPEIHDQLKTVADAQTRVAGRNQDRAYSSSGPARTPTDRNRFSSRSAAPVAAKDPVASMPRTLNGNIPKSAAAPAKPAAAAAEAAVKSPHKFKTKTKVGAGILAATGAAAGGNAYWRSRKRQLEDNVYSEKAASLDLVNPFEEVIVFGKAYPVALPVPSSTRISALVPTGSHISHVNRLVHVRGPGARPRKQELQHFTGTKGGGQHGLTQVHKGRRLPAEKLEAAGRRVTRKGKLAAGKQLRAEHGHGERDWFGGKSLYAGPVEEGAKVLGRQQKVVNATTKASRKLSAGAIRTANSPKIGQTADWTGKHKGRLALGAVGVGGVGALARNSNMPSGPSAGYRLD